jgi:hypothetical protein
MREANATVHRFHREATGPREPDGTSARGARMTLVLPSAPPVMTMIFGLPKLEKQR